MKILAPSVHMCYCLASGHCCPHGHCERRHRIASSTKCSRTLYFSRRLEARLPLRVELCRVSQDVNADMVSILISRLMGKDMANTSNTSGRGSATQTLLASDNTFGLIKSLLLKKGIILSSENVLGLTAWFEEHAEENLKNVKFASAVHTLITRHGSNPALCRILERLERLLQRLQSFMKKSSLAAIRKLRKKRA